MPRLTSAPPSTLLRSLGSRLGPPYLSRFHVLNPSGRAGLSPPDSPFLPSPPCSVPGRPGRARAGLRKSFSGAGERSRLEPRGQGWSKQRSLGTGGPGPGVLSHPCRCRAEVHRKLEKVHQPGWNRGGSPEEEVGGRARVKAKGCSSRGGGTSPEVHPSTQAPL